MPDYKQLRALVKTMVPAVGHTLKDCDVVIDGKSFFKSTYKRSGCQSIYGGEYDRYADFLRKLLKQFQECNVTCHVIFNGGTEADLERRKEIHNNVINHANSVDPTKGTEVYCEPIFAKDVCKEVLEELNIKYYVTEHDSWSVICSVANAFKCPTLTYNYELSLLYMDCISPKSLVYNEDAKNISCKIFNSVSVRIVLRVKHTMLPLLYTLFDETSVYFNKLNEIVDCLKAKYIMDQALRWIRRAAQNLEETLQRIQGILTDDEAKYFFEALEKNVELCKNKRYIPAVRHFQQSVKNANDKIPVPYVNLICNGTFSGSWVIFDEEQEDAMLIVLDIIFYACKSLKLRRDGKITFIGRKNIEAHVWDIDKSMEDFTVDQPDLFKNFVLQTLPGFDFKTLETIPEESWILIITLLYYCKKKLNLNLAYSIILSYVMMGPVSDEVGLIKRTNFISRDVPETDDQVKNSLTRKDCVAFVESSMDLFYVNNSKRHFDRKILHTFAEFQHCLQHMNYLNTLCGKTIKPTVYHKTINATFAYNMWLKIQNEVDVNKYVEKRLKKSTVFDWFKRIATVFEDCLLSPGMGLVQKLDSLET